MLKATLALAVASFPFAATSAQLVGPIPPEPKPKTTYVPPAPPAPPAPPPPRPAPVPEGPLPSIVQLDENGRLIPLQVNVEEAAALAIELDEASRAKVETIIASHHAEMDRRVIEQLPLVLETRKKLADLENVSDFKQFEALTRSLGPIKAPNLLEHLVREQAITPRQQRRAKAVMDAYQKAFHDDLTREVGEGNTAALLPTTGRRILKNIASDAMRSLDRLIDGAAPRSKELLAGVGMSPEQTAKAQPLLGIRSTDPRAVREGFAAVFFDVLTPEQGQALLRAAYPELAEAAGPEPEKPADSPAADPRKK